MTKEQLIERYGLEQYERILARNRVRYHNNSKFREIRKAQMKSRYHNDAEFREIRKTQVAARKKERYYNDYKFREDYKAKNRAYNKAHYVENGKIDLIENYDLAFKDNFKDWVIHHRLELHYDGTTRFTRQSLIKLDLYYNRPPSELIWLKRSDHQRLHKK